MSQPRLPAVAMRVVETPSPVDVIVPVYNRLRFLGATIESVLAQSYRNWRLIVVDDGSQEDVAGFLAAYRDARITCLAQANQGNAAARNLGIQHGSGQYVICLDSDDVWEPQFLTQIIQLLEQRQEVDVAYCQLRYIDESGASLPVNTQPDPPTDNILESLLMGLPILPSSALVRRSCFERWGAYTPGLDDWELWLRWALHGCQFAQVEQKLLKYRIHRDNFSSLYPARRAVHFATLEAIFARPNLPQAITLWRERAMARQHFVFATLALQAGRLNDAAADFVAAVQLFPVYLSDLDFYYQLACAHQGRVMLASREGFQLARATLTLNYLLRTLFSTPVCAPNLLRVERRARATAAFVLARLAYSHAADMRAARRLLCKAVAYWPPLAWRSDWCIWLLRALVGTSRIQQLKGLLLMHESPLKPKRIGNTDHR